MPLLDSDHLLPEEPTVSDQLLWRSLERALGKQFFEGCSGVLQGLLTSCVWHIQNQQLFATLVIHCPNSELSSRVINHLAEIAKVLERLTPYAKVHIHSTTTTCAEIEIHLGHVQCPLADL